MEAKNPQNEHMEIADHKPPYETTEGEHLVGKSFNPGGMAEVDHIKGLAAELIDYVRLHGKDPRCTQICITATEDAAMWGVKSVTKEPRK